MEGNYIHELRGHSVEEAFALLMDPPRCYRFLHALVIIFRAAYRCDPSLQQQMLTDMRSDPVVLPCKKITFSLASDDGLYHILKTECGLQDFPDNSAILRAICRKQNAIMYRKTAEKNIDSVPTRSQPSYYLAGLPSTGYLTSVLDSVPALKESQISPEVNPEAGQLPGMNESFHYVAGMFSASEAHGEDMSLASGSLAKGNLPPNSNDKGSKDWLIVIDKRACIEAVRQKLGDPADGDGGCAYPIDHKNLYLTTQFLDDHGMKYQTFTQEPGDLVIVQYGVIHQATQRTPNQSEAKNFACPVWTQFADELRHCGCDECQLSYVPSNKAQVNVTFKSRKITVHLCTECKWDTLNRKRLRIHMREVHNMTIPPRRSYPCDICGIRVTHLARHAASERHQILIKQPGAMDRVPIEHKKKCPYCHNFFLIFEFPQHRDTCASKGTQCEVCHKSYVRRRVLRAHRRKNHPELPELP